MNASNDIDAFWERARAYRNKLFGYFLISLGFSLFFYAIADWAENKTGWEGSIVDFLFYWTAIALFFLCFFFGAIISWFRFRKMGKFALRDFADRPEVLMKLPEVRNLVGPVPWGWGRK